MCCDGKKMGKKLGVGVGDSKSRNSLCLRIHSLSSYCFAYLVIRTQSEAFLSLITVDPNKQIKINTVKELNFLAKGLRALMLESILQKKSLVKTIASSLTKGNISFTLINSLKIGLETPMLSNNEPKAFRRRQRAESRSGG